MNISRELEIAMRVRTHETIPRLLESLMNQVPYASWYKAPTQPRTTFYLGEREFELCACGYKALYQLTKEDLALFYEREPEINSLRLRQLLLWIREHAEYSKTCIGHPRK